jgi:hypothetical protein
MACCSKGAGDLEGVAVVGRHRLGLVRDEHDVGRRLDVRAHRVPVVVEAVDLGRDIYARGRGRVSLSTTFDAGHAGGGPGGGVAGAGARAATDHPRLVAVLGDLVDLTTLAHDECDEGDEHHEQQQHAAARTAAEDLIARPPPPR